MSHLESLIAEYLDWQGFLIRKNTKVGRLKHGGWEGELDIVGFHPRSKELVHYEPSLDAHSWVKREVRYAKKFKFGRKYILRDLFPWLPPDTELKQFAVFPSHPRNRDSIAGGRIISIDELVAKIKSKVMECGVLRSNAIPEQYPLLRTIQMSHVGYNKLIKVPS